MESRKPEVIERENRLVVAKCGGNGYVFKGHKLPVTHLITSGYVMHSILTIVRNISLCWGKFPLCLLSGGFLS